MTLLKTKAQIRDLLTARRSRETFAEPYRKTSPSGSGEARPSYIGLGHELLGHAYLYDVIGNSSAPITGKLVTPFTSKDKITYTTGSLSATELRVLTFENIMRADYNKLIIDSKINDQMSETEVSEIKKGYLKMRTTYGSPRGNVLITPEMFKEANK